MMSMTSSAVKTLRCRQALQSGAHAASTAVFRRLIQRW